MTSQPMRKTTTRKKGLSTQEVSKQSDQGRRVDGLVASNVPSARPAFNIFQDSDECDNIQPSIPSVSHWSASAGAGNGQIGITDFNLRSLLLEAWSLMVGAPKIRHTQKSLSVSRFCVNRNLSDSSRRLFSRHLNASGVKVLITEDAKLASVKKDRLFTREEVILKVNRYCDILQDTKKFGRTTAAHSANLYLEDEEENLLVEVINNTCMMGATTDFEFIESVLNSLLKEKLGDDFEGVGDRYVREFCNRNNLTAYKSRGVDKARLEMITRNTRDIFFARLVESVKLCHAQGRCKYTCYSDFPPQKIYNMDETSADFLSNRPKQYGRKTKSTASSMQKCNEGDKMNVHVSQALTSRADGKYFTEENPDGACGPMLIIQTSSSSGKEKDQRAQHKWEEQLNNIPLAYVEALIDIDEDQEGNIKYTNDHNIAVLTSPNGSMQQNLIGHYAEHFIETLPKDREGDDMVILIMDHHASRDSWPFLRKMFLANVFIVILASHTSIVSQPLDLGTNSAKKAYEGREMKTWRFENPTKKPSMTETLQTIKTGWIKFIKEEHARLSDGESNTAENSFRRAGLFPFDPLGDIEMNIAIENLENVSIEERLKPYVVSLNNLEEHDDDGELANARALLEGLKNPAYVHDDYLTIAFKVVSSLLTQWDNASRQTSFLRLAASKEDDIVYAALTFFDAAPAEDIIAEELQYRKHRADLYSKEALKRKWQTTISMADPGASIYFYQHGNDENRMTAFRVTTTKWIIVDGDKDSFISHDMFVAEEKYFTKSGQNRQFNRSSFAAYERRQRREARAEEQRNYRAGSLELRSRHFPERVAMLVQSLNEHDKDFANKDFCEGGKFYEYLCRFQVLTSFDTLHMVEPNGKESSVCNNLYFEMVKKNLRCLNCKCSLSDEHIENNDLVQQRKRRLQINPICCGGNLYQLLDIAQEKMKKKDDAEKGRNDKKAESNRKNLIKQYTLVAKLPSSIKRCVDLKDIYNYKTVPMIQGLIIVLTGDLMKEKKEVLKAFAVESLGKYKIDKEIVKLKLNKLVEDIGAIDTNDTSLKSYGEDDWLSDDASSDDSSSSSTSTNNEHDSASGSTSSNNEHDSDCSRCSTNGGEAQSGALENSERSVSLDQDSLETCDSNGHDDDDSINSSGISIDEFCITEVSNDVLQASNEHVRKQMEKLHGLTFDRIDVSDDGTLNKIGSLTYATIRTETLKEVCRQFRVPGVDACDKKNDFAQTLVEYAQTRTMVLVRDN